MTTKARQQFCPVIRFNLEIEKVNNQHQAAFFWLVCHTLLGLVWFGLYGDLRRLQHRIAYGSVLNRELTKSSHTRYLN